MKKALLLVVLLLLATLSFAQSNDYIHLNKVAAKLEAGQLVIGTWVSALHPSNAAGLVEFNQFPDAEESLMRPMLDFILIDMEHQPHDMSLLRNFLLAMNSKREVMVKGNLQPNIATFVRLPADGAEPVHALIKQALDIGVHGVVVPHVKNAQEAEKIVKACRYVPSADSKLREPAGIRGASPWLASYAWGLSMPDYVKRADVWPLNPQGDLMAVVMIEDRDGVKNIEEILKVKGIGAVIFGPYDFSFSIGHPGEVTHPEVLKTWDLVQSACDKAGVPLIGFANENNIKEILKKDFRMLLVGHDVRPTGTLRAVIDAVVESSK